MTVSSPVSSPLLIQSSKLIEWLLNRKLLQKNYPKCLAMLEDQVNTQIELLPDNVVYPLESPSTFLASVQTYEAIQKVDTQTDFFGRASHSVRSWRDIVDGFKKQNIHIAELSESLQELAAVGVPKCKSIITDEQKHITDLRQKIKEYSLNASKLDDAMEKAFREFSLEINEPQIRLRLLEQAAEVFPRLDEIVSSLNDLRPALELYETMTNYVRHVSRSSSKERNSDPVKCCPTLKLLIESGHVRLYTWQTGRSTEHWGPDDDWIPGLLEQERELQKKLNPEALLADAAQSVDTETNEITWDEGDIDFGPIEIETDDGAPVEIDFDVEVVNENGDKPDDPQTDVQLTETHSASANIPSGKNARLLLDTVQGRNALVNDLVELGAFLGRFCEDLSESQDAAENDIRTASAQGGSIALQQMILQNAPACLQSVSSKDVTALLNRLESIRDGLTNSVLSQLLMIRSKPGFLDRLVTRLQDMRNQEERSKRRVAEAQLQINEAMAEQERQAAILLKHRADCKRLVTLIEEEISKLCNRPVQVIGQVLNL
ncbi:CDK5 regulatory subunit-associated protein 3 (CDK5 activator-binding protein C53) [Fasciola hepatica]|uniref:CDK5 regulatory subunit-associated protein 3 (CDK5 activator-binding protein C53) n=1 Tax=Fasciola hepatica TaxID=6192 RepID=A0A4E0R6S6_FASHE|nr:CDK5 regulatory subunit-associated protein 3 (CDK5 activator-binding protein C53) [Fasciola hepatica]